jgi:hypothetical protein
MAIIIIMTMSESGEEEEELLKIHSRRMWIGRKFGKEEMDKGKYS